MLVEHSLCDNEHLITERCTVDEVQSGFLVLPEMTRFNLGAVLRSLLTNIAFFVGLGNELTAEKFPIFFDHRHIFHTWCSDYRCCSDTEQTAERVLSVLCFFAELHKLRDIFLLLLPVQLSIDHLLKVATNVDFLLREKTQVHSRCRSCLKEQHFVGH